MKLSKTKKLLILFLAIILSTVIWFRFFSPWAQMYYISLWEYKVDNFDTYKDDFQNIASLAYREFSKGKMVDPFIIVHDNPNGGVSLRCKNRNTKDLIDIKMSQKEQESLNKIVKNAFHEDGMAYLELIRLNNNQVEFEIANGQYSLVYRKDGSKPKFEDLDDSKITFKTKRITDHWYHVRFESD